MPRAAGLLPVVVGVLFSLLSVFLWQALLENEREQLRRATSQAAKDAAAAVQNRTELRLGRLARMARRWEEWGPFNQQEWTFDAALNFEPQGFEAIELLEPDGRVRWVVPSAQADPGAMQEPGQKEALEASAQRRSGAPGPLIQVSEGEPGFRFFVPCRRAGEVEVYVAGVFSIPELMETALEGVARDYRVAVHAGGGMAYVREMADAESRREWASEEEVDLGGVKVRLELWPSAATLAASETVLPGVALGMGLVLSWLLALAVGLAQRGRARAEALEKEVHIRELAEEALEMSQDRYRVVTETASDAIVSIDEQSKIVFANPAVEKVFGWGPGELRGKELTVLMPEAFRELHRKAIKRYLETGRRHLNWESMELTGLHRDGREIPLEVSFGEQVKKGRHLFTGIVRDITERKRAEEALKASEEKFRALAESAASAIFISRGDRFLYVNPATENILRYPREELLERDFWSVVHPEDRELVQRMRQARLEGQPVPERYEFRVVTKEQEVRWVDFTATLVSYDSQQAVLGTAFDVTDRKQAEEALQRSEERYRLLFEKNPHAMWVFDQRTLKFLAVNEAAVQQYGYTEEEFLGMTIKDIRPPEEMARLEAHLARNPEAKGPGSAGVWRHRKKDGSLIDVEVTSEPLVLGERAAKLVLAVDITEKRRLEEQFFQSQKMEAVGRLAGGVAHDFNNLLMLIRGYSELMLEHAGADATEKQYAREVIEAADRAAQLTQQLLAFSRKQVLEPKVVSLNQALEEMEKMLRRVLGEDVEVEVRRKATRPWVKVDPTQLEQVILNLAVNARDAMPEGGLLTLETANVELDEEYARNRPDVRPGEYVMLAVSDTGAGMTEEVMAHAFDPFFTTKEKGKGTGLGLATVYGIVKQSGGNIWVYSEPGKGTSFKIYLPLVGAPAEEEAVREAVEVARLAGATVLLAEDDDRVRALGRQFLEGSGYRVLEAATAAEALDLMARHRSEVEVLVTDVVMPKMSGRELAERVAWLKPGVRVLYMSGYTDDVVVRHGELAAGTAFLQKPFTKEALARKLRELLGT